MPANWWWLAQESGAALMTHEQPKGVDIMSGLTKKIIAIAGASAFVGSAAIAADLTVVSWGGAYTCLLYTSPSPRDGLLSRMPSSA